MVRVALPSPRRSYSLRRLVAAGALLTVLGGSVAGLAYAAGSTVTVQVTGQTVTLVGSHWPHRDSGYLTISGQRFVVNTTRNGRFTVNIGTPAAGSYAGAVTIKLPGARLERVVFSVTIPDLSGSYPGGSSNSGAGTATPELGSGELLTIGLAPLIGLVLYRRRHGHDAA